MTEPLKVRCDKCHKKFAADLKEVPTLGGARLEFSCPKCGEVYQVAYITDRGLALRARLQDLLEASNLIQKGDKIGATGSLAALDKLRKDNPNVGQEIEDVARAYAREVTRLAGSSGRVKR